ncbi:hypothetical protein D9758_002694 [Tetrapyrgos nigripes]|uniref:DUF6535 domain-containing protein n=1 Tax=Tetrapyrgos nigripes TaxID=182062 RepID=A0A8H5GQX8_9AGAR|nr:hypothetical protein D9758_002694 [Tetrapyrgos nigripes]
MAMYFKWLKNVLQLLRFLKAPGDVESSHSLHAFDDTSTGYRPPGDLDNDRKPHKSPKKPFQPTADDQACAKMWSIYIGEAQRYDGALLEGWKEDMAGMLLFSALYSASLTAFLIESYKTLQPDPALDTVFLLSHISQQLSNSTVLSSGPPSFEAPVSAIVCNVLWFLSLALALTCSLLATFVQQWTRDFIHKTTLRPAPIRQARVFAYMYFGLRDFGMHSFVDVIPILLHVSLFLFFGGLVAFLFPVNRIITYIMICVLVVFLLIYTTLTVIPLLYLNAPYRTPLSGALWRFGNAFGGFLARKHGLYRQDETLTEGLLEKSLQGTSECDRRALVFTMKSLTDHEELLPMIEAIQDVLYDDSQNSGCIRKPNVHLIKPLLMTDDPEVNIISRITQYLKRSQAVPQDSPQDSPLHGRGVVACFQTVYSLVYTLATTPLVTGESQMLNEKYVQTHLTFTEDLLVHIAGVSSKHHKSLSSVIALLRFRWISCIRDVVALISRIVDDMSKANSQNAPASILRGQISHLNKIWESLDEKRMRTRAILDSAGPTYSAPCFHRLPRTLELAGEALKEWGTSVERSTERCPAAVLDELGAALATLQQDDTWDVTRSTILFEYLWQVTAEKPEIGISELPRDFERIWNIIYPPRLSLYSVGLSMSLGDDYTYPLFTLSRWVLDESTAIDCKVDLWMGKYVQLFLSIKDAQLNPDLAIWGRNFFLRYFSRRAKDAVAKPPHDSGWFYNFMYRHDYRRLVGECIIQNMRYETTPELLTCEAAFLFSLFCVVNPTGSQSLVLSELWKILDDSDKTSSTQNTDILFLRITLSLINIHRISWGTRWRDELQPMEATLLQRYLSDDLISPLSPATLRLSLWVALQTEWLDQLTQNRPFAQLDLCDLFCEWKIRFPRVPMGSKVNEKLQNRFAEIYSNFIMGMVSEESEDGPESDDYLDRVHPSVYNFFANKYDVFQWRWITDLECAEIIMRAIQKYRSRFDRGEEIEGQSSLFARCQKIHGPLAASEDVHGEGNETAE